PYDYTIFAHMDDTRTDTGTGCSSFPGGCGIFTSVSGSAPYRTFYIEWRVVYFDSPTQTADFEVRLDEWDRRRFDLMYGAVAQAGTSATVGVQGPPLLYTQYECNAGGLTNGLRITFTQPICVTPTPCAISFP